MPIIKISIEYTTDEFRDRVLDEIRTPDNGTLGTVYDSIIEGLEKQGLTDDYIKEHVAVMLFDNINQVITKAMGIDVE